VLKIVTDNKLACIAIHILIGFAATFSFFPKLFGIVILIAGIIILIASSNKNEEALLLSSYFVGVEVFLRMTKGFISYETGKYAVLVFLTIGMLIGPLKQKLTITYVIYILLLLLGIVFTQVPEGESIRKAIVFNLSGPIVLGVSALYLYKRRLSFSELKEMLFFMLLPIFSMIAYMYLRTPNLKEIAFGGVSLGETSGGFGPNQVATMLGIGMFILAVFLFLKIKITGFQILDVLLLAYFTYRGLLTFSRGGIITAGFSFVFFALYIIIHRKGSFMLIFKYIAISAVFLFSVWIYTSGVTGGMLDNRYAGKNASGVKKGDITSGRGEIIEMQIESFKSAPLFGIGVGNGKYKRELSDKKVTAASHNEVSRLVEEHGSIGIVILILLIVLPTMHFYSSTNFQRAFTAAFFLFWFLTVNHSAMRIAFPGFLYGLSLIKLQKENE
jgi:hypothetical protein